MVDDRTPSSDINSAFDSSRNQAAHDKALQADSDHLQTEMKIKDGKLDSNNTPKFINQGRIGSAENTPEKKEERRRKDQAIVAKILDQMRDRLATLEQQMAERLIILQAKYGEDAIGGMAAEFLGDEAANLRTEHERLEALAEHFLDGAGNIKPEFAGSDEALFVRDWNEANSIQTLLNRFEGQSSFTIEDINEIEAVAKSVGLSVNDTVLGSSGLSEAERASNEQALNAHTQVDEVKTSTALVFGN